MKKLTLVIALLAIVSVSLISFTVFKAPKKEKQVAYTWIAYGCGTYGSAQPLITSTGVNYFMTYDSQNPSPNSCPSPSGVCAVRFVSGETEPIPGYNGHLRPKSGVNPWQSGRPYLTCHQ